MKYLHPLLEVLKWVQQHKLFALTVASIVCNAYLGKWLMESNAKQVEILQKNESKKAEDNEILKDVLSITKTFLIKDSCK
jgi:hypothetical protein